MEDFFEFTHRDLQPRLEDDLDYRTALWIDEITASVRDTLRREPSIVPVQRLTQVFGAAVGLARETHLREALRRLEAEGVVPAGSSKGELGSKTITRSPDWAA